MAQPSALEVVARGFCVQRKLTFAEKVGEGAFKETFRVSDAAGVPLALKVHKAPGPTKRTQREIEAMLRCNHPNIAKLFAVESFRVGGSEYLCTTEEYLPGGALSVRSTLAPVECLPIGLQLIDAVAHTASLQLVHRDIKPDNVMFRADGVTPVLVDFGLVRDLTDTSLTPSLAPLGPGTPFFAAPEQLNNEKHQIDWRADQFSLGIVLSYMLFGAHPYQQPGMADHEVVNWVAARQPLNASFAGRAAGVGLPVLIRMVSVWPVQRFRIPNQLRAAWKSQAV